VWHGDRASGAAQRGCRLPLQSLHKKTAHDKKRELAIETKAQTYEWNRYGWCGFDLEPMTDMVRFLEKGM
jgi:hypothetical protein